MTDLLHTLRPGLRFTPRDGELDRLVSSYQALQTQCQDQVTAAAMLLAAMQWFQADAARLQQARCLLMAYGLIDHDLPDAVRYSLPNMLHDVEAA